MQRICKRNIEALVERLKAKRYRAKLVRRKYIPKENGKERPLGIPALEDKLVQVACAKLLMAIYEQDFLSAVTAIAPDVGRWMRSRTSPLTCSTGVMGMWSRPMSRASMTTWTMTWLLKMLSLRIDDRAFLGLIRKWLKAGILDDRWSRSSIQRSERRKAGISRPSWRMCICITRWTCGLRRLSNRIVVAKR